MNQEEVGDEIGAQQKEEGECKPEDSPTMVWCYMWTDSQGLNKLYFCSSCCHIVAWLYVTHDYVASMKAPWSM